MSLQTAVSLAEIVTALAVVVSLVYAANEFSRSRDLTSTDVQTIVYDRMLEMDRLLIENKDIADILVRVTKDPGGLTAADTARFLAYEHIFYDSWELTWTAYNEGILKEDAWKDWNAWFAAEAGRRSPSGWAGNRKNHGDDFVQYVESRVTRE
ncbi:MAG TPA: hypothetical protein VLV83_12820 [Acidobacteriota bacterium]|nr:hypothetical protein [Acidobacteriota bacterium]